MKANRIDIFQAMDGGAQPTVIGARQAGCKAVAVYCAPPPEEPVDKLTRSFSRQSFAAADARVGLSRHSIGTWAEFLGVDAKEFQLIYNGVDVEDFTGIDPAQVRAELGIPQSAIVVGMTGRMTAEKGPTILARAAVSIAKAFPEALFVFTGGGNELSAIERFFREAELSNRVRLLGFRIDAPRVAAVYDVAVVPSVFSEPFGIVVIEAMAWAKPVIGSRTGGIPEIIVDGKTGILVESGDSQMLAKALSELLASPARRIEMGRAGFERVTEQFTRKAMFNGYERLYGELLASAT
jgi:glycosyltransferase involved in cell wall biosynthesis